MARRKLNYREGDWVAVPVWEGGWVPGIAARVDGRGGVLGYFLVRGGLRCRCWMIWWA
jgi:hypothetical protein